MGDKLINLINDQYKLAKWYESAGPWTGVSQIPETFINVASLNKGSDDSSIDKIYKANLTDRYIKYLNDQYQTFIDSNPNASMWSRIVQKYIDKYPNIIDELYKSESVPAEKKYKKLFQQINNTTPQTPLQVITYQVLEQASNFEDNKSGLFKSGDKNNFIYKTILFPFGFEEVLPKSIEEIINIIRKDYTQISDKTKTLQDLKKEINVIVLAKYIKPSAKISYSSLYNKDLYDINILLQENYTKLNRLNLDIKTTSGFQFNSLTEIRQQIFDTKQKINNLKKQKDKFIDTNQNIYVSSVGAYKLPSALVNKGKVNGFTNQIPSSVKKDKPWLVLVQVDNNEFIPFGGSNDWQLWNSLNEIPFNYIFKSKNTQIPHTDKIMTPITNTMNVIKLYREQNLEKYTPLSGNLQNILSNTLGDLNSYDGSPEEIMKSIYKKLVSSQELQKPIREAQILNIEFNKACVETALALTKLIDNNEKELSIPIVYFQNYIISAENQYNIKRDADILNKML